MALIQKGQQLWKLNKKRGQLYDNPDMLREHIEGYFEWAEANPLEEEVVSFFQGIDCRAVLNKRRAFTITGLCVYLGISQSAWKVWRDTRKDLQEVVAWADDIIFEQKFTGAAAGQFNAALIGRELGLVDKQEHTSSTTVIIKGNDADL
jgi:hypothetical protein